jgi:hypothetical protein
MEHANCELHTTREIWEIASKAGFWSTGHRGVERTGTPDIGVATMNPQDSVVFPLYFHPGSF